MTREYRHSIMAVSVSAVGGENLRMFSHTDQTHTISLDTEGGVVTLCIDDSTALALRVMLEDAVRGGTIDNSDGAYEAAAKKLAGTVYRRAGMLAACKPHARQMCDGGTVKQQQGATDDDNDDERQVCGTVEPPYGECTKCGLATDDLDALSLCVHCSANTDPAA